MKPGAVQRRVWTAWPLIVVAGVVLGLAARLVDSAFPRWIANIGAVWFLVAFFVGRGSRGAVRGALAGALALSVATLTYYAWRLGADRSISAGYLLGAGTFWMVAAIGTGSIGGWAGERSRSAPLAWSMPIGVLIGEAVGVLIRSQRLLQVGAELMAAGLLIAHADANARTLALPTILVAAATCSFVLAYRAVLA